MKKYFVRNYKSDLLYVDSDNLSNYDLIDHNNGNRDWQWFIQEDGELTYNGANYTVKRGDLVVMCYSDVAMTGNDRKLIVIPALEWYEHAIAYGKFIKEKRDRCVDCDKPSNVMSENYV